MPLTTKKSPVAVSIRNITKSFGNNLVLDNINLDVNDGEFFTLIGPSGCGKTTLLRILAGFHRADGGQVLFKGKDISSLPPWKRNIGFVFQNYALWPHMTIFDNIAYGLRIQKKSAEAIRSKVKWALEVVDLSGVEKKHPGELSGGMQQRVAIARAIVIDPSILLLDEPLSNLDAKLRVSLRKHVRDIQKNLGITAVYVTHDQEEALEISDRIALMHGGLLQQVGRPEELYERPANLFAADFLGEANFFEGTLDQSGVFRAKGRKWSIDTNNQGSAAKAITLMVRPENVTVVKQGEKYDLQGVIADRVYLGSLRKYLVRLDDGTEIHLEAQREDYPIDASVQLRLEKSRLIPETNTNVIKDAV